MPGISTRYFLSVLPPISNVVNCTFHHQHNHFNDHNHGRRSRHRGSRRRHGGGRIDMDK